MATMIAIGRSESFDPVEAFSEAAADAAAGLDGAADLAVVFAGAPHLAQAPALLDAVHDRLRPRNLIGCGAGGVLGAGKEIEEGPGAVVWALSAREAEISTHHVTAARGPEGFVLDPVAEELEPGAALLVLADPYSFPCEALLDRLERDHPGAPVLGGLSSAAGAGSACLFRDREVLAEGAVACSLDGIEVIPCVSQGAEPVGPEMTVTACEGNVISELASKPAIARLREAIAALEEREQKLVAGGLLLGVVIDENQPSYVRGDFLVRPIIGADERSGALVIGERVRVGQTVRIHVRDPECADEDLREALGTRTAALPNAGAAGALVFTCNGRGRHMFGVPDHDVVTIEDALAAPAAGFFCAGEIGPVGRRNFLHGFTATVAVFPR